MNCQLIEMRKKRGLTRVHLGELIGADRSYVHLLEKNKFKPSFDKMFLIADALDCKIEDVFRDVYEGKNSKYFEGTNIKKLRIKAGLKQKEVVERTHISQCMLSMYETGKRKPLFYNASILADFYKVDIKVILGEEMI